MPKIHRTRRFGAALVAAATVGVAMPVAGVAASASAASCVAPSGLYADDALRGDVNNTQGLLDPRLSWNPVAGAAAYEVEFSPNEDFTNNVAPTWDVFDVSDRYDIPRGVIKPITYFWRVRVKGAACWSDDGATPASQFNGGIIPAPAQLTPASNATVAPSALTFSWSPVREASAYVLEVGDPDTGALIGTCVTDHTSWTPDDATEPGTSGDCFSLSKLGYNLDYTWSVAALDGTAQSPTSTTYPDNGVTDDHGHPKTHQQSPIEISSVVPATGPTSGNTTVLVTGGTFTSSDTATVGGLPATVTFVDSTHLSIVTPEATSHGNDDIVVTHCYSGCGAGQTPVQVSSVTSPRDIFRYTDGGFDSPVSVQLPSNMTIGKWSPTLTFTLGAPAPLGIAYSSLATPSGLSATATNATGSTAYSCNYPATCSDTPTFTWNAVPNATAYRVQVAEGAEVNGGGTVIVASYETEAPTVTPRGDYLDNQAGMAYWWRVQACTDDGCNSATPWANFVKRSTPMTGLSPVDGSTVQNFNVVLSWNEWQASANIGFAPQGYHVQIATDCLFTSIVDDQVTDFPEYVNTDKTYDDGTYYWRVQPVDQSGNPLTWSAPNRDTTTCTDVPSFQLHKVIAGAGTVPGSPAAKTIVLDSNVKAIAKTGKWSSKSAVKAHNKTTLVTDGKKHQSIVLSFTGTTSTVWWCTGPLNGYFNIYLDNKLKKTVNSYHAFTTCGSSLKITGLEAGAHTIKIMATGKKGKHAAQVSVDYFTYS